MSTFDYGDTDPYATTPVLAPSAESPPPASDINLAPGSTPDYDALIKSDPGYVQAQNVATSAQAGADAQRRASVRDAYVKYGGGLPSGWADKYGDIDQATQDAAAGNPFSTIATLKTNYDKSVDSFRRALSARGMLQSGELNYGQDQLDRGLGQGQYDAANAFAGRAGDLYSSYAGVLGQNARDLASAVGTASGNAYSNPANRPIPPTTAHYDTTNSAKYGQPVYSDAWGTLYDRYGNVLVQGTPPPVAKTTPATGVAPSPGGDNAAPAGGAPATAQILDGNGNVVTIPATPETAAILAAENPPGPAASPAQQQAAQQAAQDYLRSIIPTTSLGVDTSSAESTPTYSPSPAINPLSGAPLPNVGALANSYAAAGSPTLAQMQAAGTDPFAAYAPSPSTGLISDAALSGGYGGKTPGVRNLASAPSPYVAPAPQPEIPYYPAVTPDAVQAYQEANPLDTSAINPDVEVYQPSSQYWKWA